MLRSLCFRCRAKLPAGKRDRRDPAWSECFLCECEASATTVLSVRKRSDSNNCFICAKA
ncbi:hypothetical protein [Lysinibacillus sp. G4S2]|uniref:hypothetical protein n=1 Tax=Lysinibacillus sp. G4S2 TaxID=3055859 RepID=UPI0025A21ADA|nr:hypothetical protein [Lysinibacillus sp. G4S2]MDM5247781.1 hypothetical protein [Lysinibacillus sp. G4S2]